MIHNTEYIGDLVSGVATTNVSLSPFLAQQYVVNPAASWLPFLSALASNFEEFKFLKLSFIYKSTSGSALNSVNTALGSVGISSYNNAGQGQIIPTSKIQVEAMSNSVSGSPAKSHVHHVHLGSSNPLGTLYVGNPNGAPSGSDQRFFNVASVYVWSQGLQCTIPSNLGEIYVRYSILLKRPRVFSNQFCYNNLTSKYEYYSPALSQALSTGSKFLAGNNLFSAPTITSTPTSLLQPTFAAPSILGANTNNMQALTFACDGTSSAMQFPSSILFGNYLIAYKYLGWNTWTDPATNVTVQTSTTQTAATPLVSRGCTFPNLFYGAAGGASPFLLTGTCGQASTVNQEGIVLACNINTTSNQPAQVVINASANILSTSPQYVDLTVIPFNGFVNTYS
jgi:hypothetical protein